MSGQLEAVEVEGEAEQECLAGLSGDGSAGSAAGEFAFDGGEDALDQGAFSIELTGEVLTHLGACAGGAATGEAGGGDDAVGLEQFAAEEMIAFGIELGVGQHAADWDLAVCLKHQRRQGGTVVPGSLPGMLGQDDLAVHIDYSQPFQPVLPGAWLVAEMFHAADEVAADRTLRKSGGIDGYRGWTSPPPGHASHDLTHRPRHIFFLKPQQKTIERGMVGNRVQPKRRAQLRMLTQPHLGFAEGPVLIAHQTQHRLHLRLRELSLTELGATRRQDGFADFQRQPGELDQPNFRHRRLRKRLSSSSLTPFLPSSSIPHRGCQQSH